MAGSVQARASYSTGPIRQTNLASPSQLGLNFHEVLAGHLQIGANCKASGKARSIVIRPPGRIRADERLQGQIHPSAVRLWGRVPKSGRPHRLRCMAELVSENDFDRTNRISIIGRSFLAIRFLRPSKRTGDASPNPVWTLRPDSSIRFENGGVSSRPERGFQEGVGRELILNCASSHFPVLSFGKCSLGGISK